MALGASVGQLSLALRQAGSLQTTEAARRIGLEDLGKTSEVEVAKPSSSPIVTVTRGARERILYEFTPTGRRELQGTGHFICHRTRPTCCVGDGCFASHRETSVRVRRRFPQERQKCSVAGEKCIALAK